MIISQSRQFVFVHLHKTGGESVTSTLAPHLGLFDIVLGVPGAPHDDATTRRLRGFGLGKHSGAAEIRAVLGADVWAAWKTFSVVREPVDRMRSLYGYLLGIRARATPSLRQRLTGRRIDRASPPWSWPTMQILEQTRDFSSFVRHREFGSTADTRPQIDSLSADGKPIVARVQQFETLGRDWSSVCDWLGVPFTPLAHANRSAVRPVEPMDRDYLREFFARDYEAFGYWSS